MSGPKNVVTHACRKLTLGPEMAGRHGYVYSIRLGGNVISTTAYPRPGQQLPALYSDITGPGLAPVLARLQKQP